MTTSMTNSRIAETFEQVADLLEFQGSNPFRIRAYRNSARTIRDLPELISTILADKNRKLTEIDGIGKDLAQKCEQLVQEGALEQLQELREQIPSTVLDLLRIPDLGPKKAKVLYADLGITTLEQLRVACEEGQVRQLKGFASKTEQSILHGIEIAEQANQRIKWVKADEIAQRLVEHLRACASIQRLELAGSYRRGTETVGDLDVLVVSDKSDEVMDRFGDAPDIAQVIARGETKMSIRLTTGLSVDLRVVPKESFGAALQYFTGSKSHNVALRGMAKKQGLKINEYGVFRTENGKEKYVAGGEETDVYACLSLPLFPPELREARREFEWAAQDAVPRLIELSDIQGDLHVHTTATDGKASLEEMVAAAKSRGLSYLAITDHSQRVSMARGLNAERLLKQWQEIDRLNESLGPEFNIIKGLECDILESGPLDLPDDVLAQGDWIIASIHYGQNQSRQQITDRILGALENPFVSAIAHPTGRLINRREPYEVDMEQVLAAAKQHGKLLELNANPARLDLNDIHCAVAKAQGIPVVINTDAHSESGLDTMRYGVLQARRGGLTKESVANTRPWREVHKLIGAGKS